MFGFICWKCRELTTIDIDGKVIAPQTAFESSNRPCGKCGYVHCKDSDLPFKDWPSEFSNHESVRAERFRPGFFRIATGHPESYWKQCNTCGRVLPFSAFSKHSGWGALGRQRGCRSCKGAINAVLNPRRTRQQLHEASAKRRIADLLLEGENKPLDLKDLFRRFESKCFKCAKVLGLEPVWKVLVGVRPSSGAAGWVYWVRSESPRPSACQRGCARGRAHSVRGWHGRQSRFPAPCIWTNCLLERAASDVPATTPGRGLPKTDAIAPSPPPASAPVAQRPGCTPRPGRSPTRLPPG